MKQNLLILIVGVGRTVAFPMKGIMPLAESYFKQMTSYDFQGLKASYEVAVGAAQMACDEVSGQTADQMNIPADSYALGLSGQFQHTAHLYHPEIAKYLTDLVKARWEFFKSIEFLRHSAYIKLIPDPNQPKQKSSWTTWMMGNEPATILSEYETLVRDTENILDDWDCYAEQFPSSFIEKLKKFRKNRPEMYEANVLVVDLINTVTHWPFAYCTDTIAQTVEGRLAAALANVPKPETDDPSGDNLLMQGFFEHLNSGTREWHLRTNKKRLDKAKNLSDASKQRVKEGLLAMCSVMAQTLDSSDLEPSSHCQWPN